MLRFKLTDTASAVSAAVPAVAKAESPEDQARAFGDWLASNFKVAGGISGGEPFQLHDFQLDFVAAFLARDNGSPRFRTLIHSLPRKCGKSTFMGALLLGLVLPDSPIYRQAFTGILLAPTARHAGYIPKAMLALMETAGREGEVALVQRPAPGKLKVKGGASIQLLSGDAKSGHGDDVDLAVMDEGGLFPHRQSALFQNAFDALAARDGQLLITGTRIDSPKYQELIEDKNPRTFKQVFGADPEGDTSDPAQWRKATPGLGKIKSESFLRDAYESAKAAGNLTDFECYHLNLPRSPQKALLVQYHELTPIYDPEAEPIPGEPCWIGLDLGGSSSMTAAAIAYESGVVKLVGCFPSEPMSLLDRGRKDFCGDVYSRASEAGELFTTSGAVSDLSEFLPELVKRIGPHPVVSVSCDRYRQAELITALSRAKLDWKPIWRGTGPKDGDNDIRATRRLILSKSIRMKRSLLLEAAIGEATCKIAATGAMSLDKSHPNARIDAAQAFVLSCAALLQARETPAPEYTVEVI